jgi:hypothetical protein
LKPENLLLDSDFNLKVADFGLATLLEEDVAEADAPLLRTVCGTESYMAPEVVARRAYRGSSADVWSAGVILFTCISGFPPFVKAQPGDWWFDRAAEGNYELFWRAHLRTAAFSPEVQDLLNGMFSVDPARRSCLEAIAEHPWVQAEVRDADALRADLERRAREVDRQRARERAEAARGRGGRAGGEFDAFAADADRGVSHSLPSLPAGLESLSKAGALTVFSTPLDEDDVFAILEKAVTALGGTVAVKGPKVQCTFVPQAQSGAVKMALALYAHPAADSIVIHHRTKGGDIDGARYHRVVGEITRALHGGPAFQGSGTPVSAAPLASQASATRGAAEQNTVRDYPILL